MSEWNHQLRCSIKLKQKKKAFLSNNMANKSQNIDKTKTIHWLLQATTLNTKAEYNRPARTPTGGRSNQAPQRITTTNTTQATKQASLKASDPFINAEYNRPTRTPTGGRSNQAPQRIVSTKLEFSQDASAQWARRSRAMSRVHYRASERISERCSEFITEPASELASGVQSSLPSKRAD